MYKILLLLVLTFFQLSLMADSKSFDKELKKQKKVDDENLKITLANIFGKPKLNDIPIPKGFKLLKEESFIHVAASFRKGKVFLEGELVIDDVQSFFDTQMVLADWKKLDHDKADKSFFKFTRYKLYYSKGRESCVIEIGKKKPNGKTQIFLSLTALSAK